jgi:hypothetical protein
MVLAAFKTKMQKRENRPKKHSAFGAHPFSTCTTCEDSPPIVTTGKNLPLVRNYQFLTNFILSKRTSEQYSVF